MAETPSLDKLTALVAGGGGAHLPESAENWPSEDEWHEHLRKECSWYRKASAGAPVADEKQHCQPATGKDSPPRLVVKLTPRTPEASTVVQPTVPPGGPGLFHIKGEHLPPYVEHLYKHLVGRYGKKKAYGVAIGVVKKWAAGINPGGKHPTHTHADVRAAAAKNVAQWEASKAKAHARHGSKSDHELAATVTLTSRELGSPDFPGSKIIPLPPVPRPAKEMFTAHRIDDMLRHFAHANERLVAAKKSKPMRAYHMIHVSNHLTHALDTGHGLVDSLKLNYPAENKEFEQLNKTMLLAKSVSPECKEATFAHLLQTVLYETAHAKRHVDCMLDPDPEAVWLFNWDHAASHAQGGIKHCFKLAEHIRDNYPKEAKYFDELNRAEDPEDPYTALTAGPTETKAQANYRETDSESKRCGTCSMFRDGKCTLVKGSIEEDHVCDEWEKDKQVSLVGSKATIPGGMYDVIPPPPGGKYSTYGLHQKPSQTVSPSPPLPPKVAIPTPAEVRALIPTVPDCQDPSLSETVRKFLETAAQKLERNSELDALHMIRAANHAIIPAHKADMALAMPAVYTAQVFTRIPPAEQSSATSLMKQSRARSLEWRTLEKRVHALADRIRKRYFHGVFSGPNQMARLTEAEVSALDKVLALAGQQVATGQDVSFPTESDTSQKTISVQPDDNLTISGDEARKQLTALTAVDRIRINAYMDAARAAMGEPSHYKARQLLCRAYDVAQQCGSYKLAQEIFSHIRALQDMSNNTPSPDGKQSQPRPGSGGWDSKDSVAGINTRT